MHLKLNLELTFVVASRVVFLVVKVVWKKFSTGVAKMNSRTPDTSSAPVPTKVCFNSLITGFTYTYFTTKFSFSEFLCILMILATHLCINPFHMLIHGSEIHEKELNFLFICLFSLCNLRTE